jgi:hypothetical protein
VAVHFQRQGLAAHEQHPVGEHRGGVNVHAQGRQFGEHAGVLGALVQKVQQLDHIEWKRGQRAGPSTVAQATR